MIGKSMKMRIPRSPKGVGLTVLAGLLLLALYSFNQQQVLTTLSSGQDLKADFVRDYQVAPYSTVVKVAGVQVGMVTGTSESAGEHTTVDMKLDNGVLNKLGTAPRAIIRPTTLLGGKYYIELVRDGSEGGPASGSTIPVARTAVPVELDNILSTVTPAQASQGIRKTVASLANTGNANGRRQFQAFVDQAPSTLKPLSGVLAAAEGTKPTTDLTGLVGGLQSTVKALTQQQGEVGSIIDGLDQTVSALDGVQAPLAQTFAQGSATLQATRAGLQALSPTLDRLQTTASNFTPSAQQLSQVLNALDPVLVSARPVLAQARSVAQDARPLVQDAVPTASRATTILNNVRGPVLDRLNGPITNAILTPWHGTGDYQGGGNDHPLYKETGYLLANIADVFKFHDSNQAEGRLMAGVSLSTADGITRMGLPQYLASLGIGQVGSIGSALTSPLMSGSSTMQGLTGASAGLTAPLASLTNPLSSLLGGLL